MVTYHDILQGICQKSFYISKADRKFADPRLHIKPKGKYTVLYYNGSYDSLSDIYCSLREHCEAIGFIVAGNIYQEDVLDYCSNQSSDDYVMKISMQIK